MANTIGSLVIDLVANTANFSNQLNVAVKSVEDTVSKIKSAFGALAGAFTFAGIADLTKQTLEFGDELQKASIKTGLGATGISELAFAAKQANIDLPEFTSSIDKMEKSISEASTGTGNSQKAFEALGISLSTLKNLAPDQQFALIANQINALPTAADKARAALDIFGRAGADLLPLFEEGAAGIEKARQKAVDFGASFDSDQLKKLADANTAVKDLDASFKAMATTLGAAVAPGLKAFFDTISAAVAPSSKTAALDEMMGLLTETGNSDAVKQLAAITQQVKAQTQALADRASVVSSGTAPGFLPDIQPITVNPNLKIQIDAMTKFYQDLDDATKTGGEKILDDTAKLQAQLDVLVKSGAISLSESFNREFASDNAQQTKDFFAQNAIDISLAIKKSQEDMSQSFAAMAADSKYSSQAMKEDFEQTQQNANSTAQSMQDSFATFLEDPFAGGLKKMVSAWATALEQMSAKAFAQDIFGSLFGGSSGLATVFANFLGGSFGGVAAMPSTADAALTSIGGFATGGSFSVGGNGGTDSQLVKFKATPGERVTVTTPGQQAAQGGVTLHQTVNIDARTDAAQIGQLVAQSTAYAIQQSKAQVSNMIKRGAFA